MAKVNGAVLLGLCLFALWNVDSSPTLPERPAIQVPYGGTEPNPPALEMRKRDKNDHGIG